LRKTGREIPDLSTKALRAFVAIASLGSVARAASLLGRSGSAISLQLTSLERDLGQPLFGRTGRGLSLTGFGARFLVYAEEILARVDAARQAMGTAKQGGELRIGVVQDLLGLCMPLLLSAKHMEAPESAIAMLTGTSAELAVLIGEGKLDLAVMARRYVEPDTVLTLAMRWLAAPNYEGGNPLSMVAVVQPCPFFDAAERALSRADRKVEIRFSSPSLEAVRGAAVHGAGVLCRTALAQDEKLTDVGELLNLPPLPNISYVLELRRGAGPLTVTMGDRLYAGLRSVAAK
jgi:DNA-binding transcriptional LysR family regulator